MSLYFLLGTLTHEGQKMVWDNPDFFVAATHRVEVEGAEILGQYGVLGKYDYIVMVEADDNDSVAKLSLELGVKTGLHIETLPAISIGAFTDKAPHGPLWRETSVESTPGT